MLEKITDVIVDELGCEREDINIDTNIIEDLDADSLSVMELVMALEDEFDIEVPESDIPKLKTVKDIITYIEASN